MFKNFELNLKSVKVSFIPRKFVMTVSCEFFLCILVGVKKFVMDKGFHTQFKATNLLQFQTKLINVMKKFRSCTYRAVRAMMNKIDDIDDSYKKLNSLTIFDSKKLTKSVSLMDRFLSYFTFCFECQEIYQKLSENAKKHLTGGM